MAIILPMFGTFTRQEFAKFVRLGVIFGCIIGVYWSLGALKQAVICAALGAAYVPHARIFSMLCLVPLLYIYGKLLDRYTRERVFLYITLGYVGAAILFAVLFACGQQKATTAYPFAFLCDSYGSLGIALFWAIATDTTVPESAKKGFPLIVALGQVGGIVLPLAMQALPHITDYAQLPWLLVACTVPMLFAWYWLRRFLRVTPSDLLVGFHGQQEVRSVVKTGFWEGVSLVVQHRYVLAIAVVAIVPDLLAVIFDMHFLVRAHQTYAGIHLITYLSRYGAAINGGTLLLLLCGITRCARSVSMGAALLVMPCVCLAALLSFLFFDHLNFLFGLMVCIKACNYAFNVPLIRQLYIPTTHDIRFKVQAWIDGFGLHGSKVSGSILNMLLKPLQEHAGEQMGRWYHTLLTSGLGFILICLWLPLAYRLGTWYTEAIKNNRIVC